MTDANQPFSQVVMTAVRTRRRVLVEKGIIPMTEIDSTENVERLNQLDAEWEQGCEVLVEIGAAFKGVEPKEIERETAKALAEVQSEMRAEREAAAQS